MNPKVNDQGKRVISGKIKCLYHLALGEIDCGLPTLAMQRQGQMEVLLEILQWTNDQGAISEAVELMRDLNDRRLQHGI